MIQARGLLDYMKKDLLLMVGKYKGQQKSVGR